DRHGGDESSQQGDPDKSFGQIKRRRLTLRLRMTARREVVTDNHEQEIQKVGRNRRRLADRGQEDHGADQAHDQKSQQSPHAAGRPAESMPFRRRHRRRNWSNTHRWTPYCSDFRHSWYSRNTAARSQRSRYTARARKPYSTFTSYFGSKNCQSQAGLVVCISHATPPPVGEWVRRTPSFLSTMRMKMCLR